MFSYNFAYKFNKFGIIQFAAPNFIITDEDFIPYFNREAFPFLVAEIGYWISKRVEYSHSSSHSAIILRSRSYLSWTGGRGPARVGE